MHFDWFDYTHHKYARYKQKGFTSIIILVGVLVLVSIGGWYYVSQVKTQPQKACTQEAKICPDGSSVGRSGPNCEFAPCPKSTPSPTPDETANWKIYTNTGFKYSFQYPKNWELRIDERIDDKRITVQSSDYQSHPTSGKTLTGASMTVYPPLTSKAFNPLVPKPGPIPNSGLTILSVTETEIDGLRAIYILEDHAPEKSREVRIISGDYIYMIGLSFDNLEENYYQNLFNQILSTFKFIP